VAFGLLVAFYTIHASENDFASNMREHALPLFMMGGLASTAVLFDYIQYYCGMRSGVSRSAACRPNWWRRVSDGPEGCKGGKMNATVTTPSIPAQVHARIADLLTSAPVDVMEVARRLGLGIYVSDLAKGVSGALVHDPSYETESGFVIFVDDSEAYVRQRFTAAHEIGHFVLHRDRIGEGIEDNYLLRSEGFSNWMEAQANRFAADLLMPFDLINALISQGVKDVPSLAKRLEVSEIAMGIRLGHPT
jgi:hypothetical protein